uniref:Uncharacterized protein n=1 Tax=Anopheles atroparvus TaxID=41427 RepID=A0A182IJS8_ANOAO
MPNRCWLISLVAEARLLAGMKDERRDFFAPLPLAVPVAEVSSRLSSDDLRFSKRVLGRAAAATRAAEAALCWKRVLRCFGTGVSLRLTWLPRSVASNALWNCRSACDRNGCVWQLAYVSELSTLARSPLLLLLLTKVPPTPPVPLLLLPPPPPPPPPLPIGPGPLPA